MFYACGVSVCDGGNKKASFWLPAKKAQDLPREVVRRPEQKILIGFPPEKKKRGKRTGRTPYCSGRRQQWLVAMAVSVTVILAVAVMVAVMVAVAVVVAVAVAVSVTVAVARLVTKSVGVGGGGDGGGRGNGGGSSGSGGSEVSGW
jgi:uncharacterized membrane protein YgcG